MAGILRIADMLFNQPLLATESLASSVAAYINSRMFGSNDVGLAVNFQKPDGDASQYLRVSEGTAILPIMGGLTHRATGMDALCTGGLSSYAGLTKAFDEALADQNVERIVMHVDSGGGQATGCFDLARHIMANRGSKPIIAYVDGLSASAAYALSCAADEVIASPHADVGSIGVLMVHEDYSKMLAKEGIEATVFKAGANKGMGLPYTPLSKEAKETMQARIDELYDDFTGLVSDARGTKMSQQDAKNTEASVYGSQEALKIGLIDKIMTPDEFVAYITPNSTSASVAQKPVIAQAEESNQVTEMTEQEMKEMAELRAFKLATEQSALATSMAAAVSAMQPHATAIGFDALTVVTALSTLSEEHKALFSGCIESASAKLAQAATEMSALVASHATELADVQSKAQAAIDASAALEERGGSGDAALDEGAEKNLTEAEQQAKLRAEALTDAVAKMIASGNYN
ncbi:hypothetical protein Arno162_78 [Pectobacterium phage Arno162]|uniref:Peptidase S49 domain-containing protein n=1 Tax=Pectobacterium phage Arno162 TaxID=2500577 RepID=A0A678ZJN8_9CAUD|nr:hypothetical protein Arno162_78 [Pectobacterium phage Arno162]